MSGLLLTLSEAGELLFGEKSTRNRRRAQYLLAKNNTPTIRNGRQILVKRALVRSLIFDNVIDAKSHSVTTKLPNGEISSAKIREHEISNKKRKTAKMKQKLVTSISPHAPQNPYGRYVHRMLELSKIKKREMAEDFETTPETLSRWIHGKIEVGLTDILRTKAYFTEKLWEHSIELLFQDTYEELDQLIRDESVKATLTPKELITKTKSDLKERLAEAIHLPVEKVEVQIVVKTQAHEQTFG